MPGPAAAVGEGGLTGGRRLDALVRDGASLVHHRRLLDRPDRPWQRLGADGWVPDVAMSHLDRDIDQELPSAGQLGASSRQLRGVAVARARGRWFALADLDGSVFGYQRLPDGSWERDSCLRLADREPFVVAEPESVKLAQVTGDRDATPTPGGERPPTLSSSLASAGIRGTDLGIRVDHAGRTFLLFGDTHWTRPWLGTRDSIAEVVPPARLVERVETSALRFHGSPLKLVGRAAGRTTMREYDVPLDGFSHHGRLHVFFSSNHFHNHRVMGRSVLARSADADLVIDPAARRRPLRFEVLGTFSDRHFITVSVQRRPAAEVPGCGAEGDVLLVWGTGPYRASAVRLAVVPLSGPLAADGRIAARYWAGDRWSDAEQDAVALFEPAALGELSVRWVPAAGRYLMLHASAPEDPIGNAVVLRSAAQPWGPWSRRVRLLDWVTTGMSVDPHTRFIKASRDDEAVGDRIFRAQASGGGAAYAPYLFDARADGDDLVLRYTLSTWNPYQVVLMQHRLRYDVAGGDTPLR